MLVRKVNASATAADCKIHYERKKEVYHGGTADEKEEEEIIMKRVRGTVKKVAVYNFMYIYIPKVPLQGAETIV